jgi:hypothetical protein
VVTLRFTAEEFARLEAMMEAARKCGESGSREDLVLAGVSLLAGTPSREAETSRREAETPSREAEIPSREAEPPPREAETPPRDDASRAAASAMGQSIGTAQDTRVHSAVPYQVHVMLCPQCGTGETPSSRGPLPLGLAELAAVACDARVEAGGTNRAVIPPRVRRQVLARDRYTCTSAGCGRTRFLNVHHVVPREKGGKNDPDNLRTLCSGCHRTLHDLEARGGTTRRPRAA